MKKYIALLLISLSLSSSAQTYENAGEYMNAIGKQFQEIMKDMWAYTSAANHGKSARKVEGKRKELLSTIQNGIKNISAMPPFKGDKSYRDSTVGFLKKAYHVINHDYAKIVNMEEISEQSYDALEAYYAAQDAASDKLEEASNRLNDTEKLFAGKNNVTMLENQSDIGKKMEIAGKVNSYQRVIYLIFFKSYKQELYMLDAIGKKDLAAIEQNRSTLLQFSNEGIAKLDTMKAFNGDKSLIIACKQMLEFYRNECKDKVGFLTNYLLKSESFQKTKKAFDAKKPADRTQADVDKFNKEVEDVNKAAAESNNTNAKLNEERSKNIDNWNKTSENFLDKYTPKN